MTSTSLLRRIALATANEAPADIIDACSSMIVAEIEMLADCPCEISDLFNGILTEMAQALGIEVVEVEDGAGDDENVVH